MILDTYKTKTNVFVLTEEEVLVYDKAGKVVVEKIKMMITNKNDFQTYCLDYSMDDTLFFDEIKFDMKELKAMIRKGKL